MLCNTSPRLGPTAPPAASAPSAPPLSPAYVKDTIAGITASRRQLAARASTLDLFGEKSARPDDPLEVQLLFAARDDYLAATSARERTGPMLNLIKLASAIRSEVGDASTEMNRLLITAMQSETAQRKIDAMVKIAENKNTRNAAAPSLSEMLAELQTQGSHDEDQQVGTEDGAPAGRADELPPESGAGPISAE